MNLWQGKKGAAELHRVELGLVEILFPFCLHDKVTVNSVCVCVCVIASHHINTS